MKEEPERISNIMDYLLTYASKVNWEKVEKIYPKEDVERIKRDRKALGLS